MCVYIHDSTLDSTNFIFSLNDGDNNGDNEDD